MGAKSEVQQLLDLQSGVVSRRQVLACGEAVHDIRRRLGRREWATVFDGVYVEPTGPLTWVQRAWAVVLFAWPAALSHDSALRAEDAPGRREYDDQGPIHVAVDRDRAFRAPPDVVGHRLADLEAKVRWTASPPRVRVE